MDFFFSFLFFVLKSKCINQLTTPCMRCIKDPRHNYPMFFFLKLKIKKKKKTPLQGQPIYFGMSYLILPHNLRGKQRKHSWTVPFNWSDYIMPPNSSILSQLHWTKICVHLVLLGGLLSQITTCFILIVVTSPCYMPNSHTKPSNSELVLNGILCTTTGVDGVNRSIKKMVELVFSFFLGISLSLSPKHELHFTLGWICSCILTHRESLCMLLLFLNNPSKTKGMKTKWTQVVCSTKIRNPKLILEIMYLHK